jgi:hypothetical protein
MLGKFVVSFVVCRVKVAAIAASKTAYHLSEVYCAEVVKEVPRCQT